MIEVYSDWLNKHAEANGDNYCIIRADYDEVPGDEPQVLLDWRHQDDRIIHIYANAFHDEGGPCFLTGFLSFYDGIRYDNETKEMRRMEDPHWTLDALVQEFDTLHSMIYRDGAYDPASLPQEAA